MNKTDAEVERLILGCVKLAGADGCHPSRVREELENLGVPKNWTQAIILSMLRDKKLVASKDFKLLLP